MEIKGIIRECHEQLYTNELGHLDGMDKFLETAPPMTNHKETENLNIPITRKDIEAVIIKKISQHRKATDLKSSLVNSTKYLEKNQC